MKLYVLRHGQTDLNLQHRLQARRGLPLNETGVKQAQALRDELEGVDFVAAYSSPQERAVQTVSIASGISESAIVRDERLQPFDVGEVDNEVIDERLHFVFGLVPDKALYDGVEDVEAFKVRIADFLDCVRKEYGGRDCSVIVGGHKCTTGCIEGVLNGFPSDGDFFNISTKNGRYKIYDI